MVVSKQIWAMCGLIGKMGHCYNSVVENEGGNIPVALQEDSVALYPFEHPLVLYPYNESLSGCLYHRKRNAQKKAK